MSPTGEPFDPSLVVFAALAIFVVWKLRSVLGLRIDREPPPSQFAPRPMGPSRLPGAPLLPLQCGPQLNARRHARRAIGIPKAGSHPTAAAQPRPYKAKQLAVQDNLPQALFPTHNQILIPVKPSECDPVQPSGQKTGVPAHFLEIAARHSPAADPGEKMASR